MTAVAKGRTLYELSGKARLGLDLVPWEEIRPEDKETFGAIEAALLAPLRDAVLSTALGWEREAAEYIAMAEGEDAAWPDEEQKDRAHASVLHEAISEVRAAVGAEAASVHAARNAELTARVTELEQQLATLQPEGVQR